MSDLGGDALINWLGELNMVIISRGVKVAPGWKFCSPKMKDGQFRSRFEITYQKDGYGYRVWQGRYPDRVFLGVLIHSPSTPCWAFIPHNKSDRWYIAPTRVQAINECFHFYSISEDELDEQLMKGK